MQPDESAQLQSRLSALEQENTKLRTELQVCQQRTLAFQARVAELERANALLLAELAEEAKQAEIAKEQEQAAQNRAAEQAKANAVLRRTAAQLVQQHDLNQFLESVLLEVAQEIGAKNNAIFCYNPESETLLMQTAVHDGQVVNLETDTRYEMWRSPVPANINSAWKVICSRSYAWVEFEDNEISGDEAWDFSVAWHRRMQHRRLMCVLLQVGDKPLGFMGLGFCERVDLSSERIELGLSLAQQAALAIQLTQLAEQSKQAAIAREQEKAASERAEQLAKANNALKRNLDSLATQPQLEAFLQSVVNEAAAQTNAANAYLFLYDEHTDSLSLSAATDNGGDWLRVADMELWKRPFAANSTPAWETITSSRTPVVLELEQANPLFWPGTFEWHQQRGHTRALTAPLWLGEQPLGFLSLASTVGVTFAPEELELIQALAQQATLAIELTSLAEQSRHTAVLEERNRIAREIHDTLGQAFTGIAMQLEAANRFSTTKPEQVPHCINRAQNLATAGIKQAQHSLWTLNPAADDYRDIAATLKRLAAEMTTGTAVTVEVTVEGNQPDLPPDIGLHLLRIGQEALTNALKHAQAQLIHIRITFAPHQVQLLVQDDGKGFAPQRLTSSGKGLKGMQQRAAQIGANLVVSSKPLGGTQITVTTPLAASQWTASEVKTHCVRSKERS